MVTATCPECDHVQERPTDATAELRCMICGNVFALPILSQLKLQKTQPADDDLPTSKPNQTVAKVSRKRRDSSNDDAPRRSSKGLNESGMRLLVGLSIAGALLLGVVSVGAWALFSKNKTPSVAMVTPPITAVSAPIDALVITKPVPAAVNPAPVVEVKSFIRPPEKIIAITPTLAEDDAEIILPGRVDSVCYGGGGRFVIFRIPSLKQIAVLDLSLGKVANWIPLVEDRAVFTAGMNKLYVYYPDADMFQRWNLSTFEKEVTVANPLGGSPKVILMGHATDGPLYVCGPELTKSSNIAYLDGHTFKPIELNFGKGTVPAFYPNDFASITVRVSGDGHVLSWWDREKPYSGAPDYVICNNAGKQYNRNDIPGPHLLGLDGMLFTPEGLFTSDHKALDIPKGRAHLETDHPSIPPAHGRAYIHISNDRQYNNRISLRMIGDDLSLVSLNDLRGLVINTPPSAGVDLPLYDRVFLVPKANVIAILGASRNKVYMHRYNLQEILDKSDTDYLGVASQSPKAVRGKIYRYEPEVLSKKGQVKLKLESGPDGMEIEGNAIVWDVPRLQVETAFVTLAVSDKTGKQLLHRFTIEMNEK